MPSTSITETVNQSVIATAIPLEADGVTATPGAVLSSVVWTLSNPGVVEQTVNPDNTASFKALTPGTVTVNVTALVTDADGTATTLSATNTITVTAPTERTASLQINFGVPA
jgi:hypothetical protein